MKIIKILSVVAIGILFISHAEANLKEKISNKVYKECRKVLSNEFNVCNCVAREVKTLDIKQMLGIISSDQLLKIAKNCKHRVLG